MASTAEVQSHLNAAMDKMMSNGINHLEVKEKYIFPPHERPNMSEVSHSYTIPVIDLKNMDVTGPHRSNVVHEIRRACEKDGFFQIVNHGVPESAMKCMMNIAMEFFDMPVENRACFFSEDPKQAVRLFTSFNATKDKVLNWSDTLRHPCHPLEEFIDSWPTNPPEYREIAGMYAKEIRALILRLLALISEALGLDPDYLNRTFGKHQQVMTINYYPPCPNPDLTFGVPPHSDKGGITVLMQGDVSGLHVLKDGKWVAVDPIPNAFVVNVGDQLQVLSNGKFKSCEHRAVTNSSTARMSIATFYGPSTDVFIAPVQSMIDGQNPALYKGYRLEEYMSVFRNKGLKGKSVLDSFMFRNGQ
uniref:Fe2OG dioxygenase domain-containing protein n=1 Tax=Araucaria cunninghamii TaxID=56994 RepID=A0A0D6QZJ6_ARACU